MKKHKKMSCDEWYIKCQKIGKFVLKSVLGFQKYTIHTSQHLFVFVHLSYQSIVYIEYCSLVLYSSRKVHRNNSLLASKVANRQNNPSAVNGAKSEKKNKTKQNECLFAMICFKGIMKTNYTPPLVLAQSYDDKIKQKN